MIGLGIDAVEFVQVYRTSNAKSFRSPAISFVAPGLEPRLQSAGASLGCFSRLVKRHHSIDHQIHRSLSFLKCFSLSDCPQVR